MPGLTAGGHRQAPFARVLVNCFGIGHEGLMMAVVQRDLLDVDVCMRR